MSDFNEHAESVADQYISALGRRGQISYIEYGYGDNVIVTHEDWCCGCCNVDSTEMPVRFLWIHNWRDEIEQIRADREAKRKAAEEKRKKEAEESRRKADLKRLAELKAKYEQEV